MLIIFFLLNANADCIEFALNVYSLKTPNQLIYYILSSKHFTLDAIKIIIYRFFKGLQPFKVRIYFLFLRNIK